MTTSSSPDDVGGIAANQLRAFVDRIERLEEEKKALQEDIKDVYNEAKSSGFEVKILRKVISLRKKDQADLDEEEALLEVYLHALGMRPASDTDRPAHEAAE